MTSITKKIRFDKSGYYFIALVALALLGFWPTYFSRFFNGTQNYPFYFHFHATMMTLWILTLIVQPILIINKKLNIHKLVGKLTYILMPLLFISVILLTHYQIQGHILLANGQKLYGPHLMIPFKDLLILGTAYTIAIYYRHDINIHARAMIATGIVFIEPSLIRLIRFLFIKDGGLPFLITIGIVYTLLIGLIILERKQKRGRWVFPLILGLYIIVHSLIFFHFRNNVWESFAKWFAELPLTTK